jgi:hypothetical protein
MKTLKLLFAFLLFNISINAQHLKKDGTPDKRFKENKTIAPISNQTTTIVKDTLKQFPNKIESKESKNQILTVQCAGTTKKGEQCKRMVDSSVGYCYQHKK